MTTTEPPGGRIELDIGGMTCASCAARVEQRLNRMDGVTATVNYATEKAAVTFGPEVTPDELIAQVAAAGYTASSAVRPPLGVGGASIDADARPRPRRTTTATPTARVA